MWILALSRQGVYNSLRHKHVFLYHVIPIRSFSQQKFPHRKDRHDWLALFSLLHNDGEVSQILPWHCLVPWVTQQTLFGTMGHSTDTVWYHGSLNRHCLVPWVTQQTLFAMMSFFLFLFFNLAIYKIWLSWGETFCCCCYHRLSKRHIFFCCSECYLTFLFAAVGYLTSIHPQYKEPWFGSHPKD